MLSTLLYMKRSEILMIKIIKMLQKRLKMVKSSLCYKHKHCRTHFDLFLPFIWFQLALHETKRDSAQPLARKKINYKVGLAEWSKALDLSSNTRKCA